MPCKMDKNFGSFSYGRYQSLAVSLKDLFKQTHGLDHRHLKIIDCLTARVSFIRTVNGRSKKKKKRSLFCAALVAGTINKLEQSILRLRYLWSRPNFISFRLVHEQNLLLRTNLAVS